MTRKELIKKYIEFFKKKGHKQVANSPLIPKGDPTVLFTTAGMHPLVPYLLGQPHPQGKRLVNIQRCIRTGDIDEVGDLVHNTFFEMLGNWSLGDYWKEDAIKYTFEFITKILKINEKLLAVTVFKGDKDALKDTESEEIWKSLGITNIAYLPKKDNWWGPAGNTGPCGPDTEIFYWTGEGKAQKMNPRNKKWVEIGNDVLMQYFRDEKGKYKEAKQRNIDFGGGIVRTLAVLNNLRDIYLTEIWRPIINEIEILSKKEYGKNKEETKAMRIVADHLKASVFIIADGVIPSNTEHGYVLRRLIRRAIRYKKQLGVKERISEITKPIFDIYSDYEILKNRKEILEELNKEEEKFLKTLEQGEKILLNFLKNKRNKTLDGKTSFLLYQSYGFPLELIEETAKQHKITVDVKSFKQEQSKHQSLSRTAAEGKFKSGLADNSESTTKLHTAHHLLLVALRKTLGKKVFQKGSNITAERLRLDFSFPRKVTKEELKEIESLVNGQIKKALPISKEEMPTQQALKQGALGVFGDKYGDIVSVYTIGNFSKEICTGPHVKNTKELGRFKILKEEAS
ncbi:MAG: alanine--tRNA ligase, partial [Nanoarchaeota archaeon]|nr:alanine--tRNA ligase [Nanoarchaeota archaeon]